MKTSNKAGGTMKTLTFIGVAAIFGIAIWWAEWRAKEAEKVISTSDAGEAISANYSESTFGAYTTRIETDTGIFLVQGTLAIQKGEPFMLEERKNGNKVLCKLRTKDCRTLTN